MGWKRRNGAPKRLAILSAVEWLMFDFVGIARFAWRSSHELCERGTE